MNCPFNLGSSIRFGVPSGTLNNWLQGRHSPDPAGRAYLTVIANAPETVMAALQKDAAGHTNRTKERPAHNAWAPVMETL